MPGVVRDSGHAHVPVLLRMRVAWRPPRTGRAGYAAKFVNPTQ